MKKIIKICFLKNIFLVFIALALINPSSVFAFSATANEMVAFKCEEYVGFTPEAKALIKKSREALLKRKEVFSKKFRQFESIYHAANLMRMMKGNMFLYGPPGGAKSFFVNWLLGYEKEPPFKIQMHQMMTEQVFVGGQNYESAKAGKYEVNIEGSLADHKTAIIDEIDKANPATSAALLSLLNERVVYLGSKTFHSPLETIFSTSNENLYEFHEEFKRNGQGSTAKALLNRFSCITFVPNWLERKDRLALDKERARNKNDAFYGKQEKVDEASLRLDWDGLRALANALFETTDEFDSILDDFIEKMRKESIDYTKKQENQFDKDSLLYYPTVQYTERLRQKVTEVILMSLTLDFLTSSLTDDVDKLEATLKNTKNHRFSLTPLSLWRAYTILTTVSYGTTELELKDNAPSINFSDFLDNYKAEDQRVEQMIGYIKQERGNFKSALEEIWKNHQDAVKDASSSSAMVNCLQDNTIVTQDIERILLLTKK